MSVTQHGEYQGAGTASSSCGAAILDVIYYACAFLDIAGQNVLYKTILKRTVMK